MDKLNRHRHGDRYGRERKKRERGREKRKTERKRRSALSLLNKIAIPETVFSLINLFIRSYLAKAFISCSSPGCAFTIAGAFSGIRIFQKALVSLQRVRLLISSASTSRDLCALLLYIYIFFFLRFVKLFCVFHLLVVLLFRSYFCSIFFIFSFCLLLFLYVR